MKTLTAAASALIASVVLTFAPGAEARVVGSGVQATESRAVSDFDAIAVDGSMDLVVRQAAKEAVEIQGDDNLLPLIETVVEPRAGGRTLVVRFRRSENISHRKPLRVKVDVVKLGAIATAGSGDVEVQALKTPALKLSISGSSDARLESLDTESFELRISGSGDVVASGKAKSVKVSIAGSGDANLEALAADDVNVRIAGSGDANVTAGKSLDVSVAGSGDVRYGGGATVVRASTAGSGSIHKR